MKLATFRNAGSDAVGILHAQATRIFKLAEAARHAGMADAPFTSMLALIDAGEAGLEAAAALFARHGEEPALSVALDSVQLLAPLPEPRQIRDGMSFAGHILQSSRGVKALKARIAGNEAGFAEAMAEPLGELGQVYTQVPIYYFTNRYSVAGNGSTVHWPRYSKVVDYESEIAIVTGRKAKNISVTEAKDYIFGYMIYNDFSARDTQFVEMGGSLGPSKGKSFDGGNVFGPWIVTRDEVSTPYNLAVQVRVNGEERSRGSTAGMLFSFEEILAYVAQDETVHAGEVIGSGTVASGSGLELGVFLAHGDTIEVEIEGLGVLTNHIETHS